MMFFELHSRSATPTEIPHGFSSSLLPPSFPAGRCDNSFIVQTGGATALTGLPG